MSEQTIKITVTGPPKSGKSKIVNALERYLSYIKINGNEIPDFIIEESVVLKSQAFGEPKKQNICNCCYCTDKRHNEYRNK